MTDLPASLPDELATALRRASAARRRGDVDPAAEARLEHTFACSRRLAVYGTLAPGRSNHHQLHDCLGTWVPATVTGHLGMRDYPVFTFDAHGPEVAMQMLTSDALPDVWTRLDEFEGIHYCRVLVPVRVPANTIAIANLYEHVHRATEIRGHNDGDRRH